MQWKLMQNEDQFKSRIFKNDKEKFKGVRKKRREMREK